MFEAEFYDEYDNIFIYRLGDSGVQTAAMVKDVEETGTISFHNISFTGKESEVRFTVRAVNGGSVLFEVKRADESIVSYGRWTGCAEDATKETVLLSSVVPAGTYTVKVTLSGDVRLSLFEFVEKKVFDYKSFTDRIEKMSYGGDYNPEQWPEETWKEDMRMFHMAGIDTVTVNIFSWALLQPEEDVYDFSRLDKIMEMAKENNLKVILANATAAMPAWLCKKYPEVCRVMFNTVKRKFGGRHNNCMNSPVFKRLARELSRRIAERYKDYDNIIAWHISNEYSGACYCEKCEAGFRTWLKDKYQTIENVNKAWNTTFWSHTFYDFEEIMAPNIQTEQFTEDTSEFQGMTLDYKRYMDESILNNYINEYNAVKEFTPEIPVTTNMMMLFPGLNYQKWSKYMDFISWDSYPARDENKADASLCHDLMRSLKQGDPFLLMEQTPSVQNWQPFNSIKRPGVTRLWSYRAVAHGADGICFFQLRRSIGACEKTHGAVIDHAGRDDTRAFKELITIGQELKKLGGETLGTRYPAEVAILMDWENWWDFELCAGPHRDKNYMNELKKYYYGLFKENVPVDVISVEDDLSKYKMVIAPILFMVKTGYEKKINEFVANGGTFVTTYCSGMVNETDLIYTGGYPGPLKDVLGIWVEETDSLPLTEKNTFTYNGKNYDCRMIFDIISENKGETLATYESEFYAGTPVITKNQYGAGYGYYVASCCEETFYEDFLRDLVDRLNVKRVWKPEDEVEVTMRENEEYQFYFLLNHNDHAVDLVSEVTGVDILTDEEIAANDPISLDRKGVMILKVKK